MDRTAIKRFMSLEEAKNLLRGHIDSGNVSAAFRLVRKDENAAHVAVTLQDFAQVRNL